MSKGISRVEHLATKEERATVKRIIILSVLSIVLVTLLITLGISALGKFADFTETIFKKKEVLVNQPPPQPPRLDRLPTATNSARLTVSGFGEKDTTVQIYQNQEKIADVKTTTEKFRYEDLTLKKGKNEILAKTVNAAGQTSDFSQSQTIILDLEEPKLEIESPVEGQTFYLENRIKVSGKTENDAQVYANGFLAVVDSGGKFDVTIPLVEGENTVEIKAIDFAGNIKVDTRKVNFRK